MLTSRGERLSPAEMQTAGLAACELKPLHHKNLRLTISQVLDAQHTPLPCPELHATTPVKPIAHPHRILAVEDNPVNQKVIQLVLSKLGYSVDIARNGEEALAALPKKDYALILMDEHMPDMDGLVATRRIRESQAAGLHGFPPHLPIIALTANAMVGDREACIEAGMDDYLPKPVNSDALNTMLNRYLAGDTQSTAPRTSGVLT
jgi:CheY-like chemotaxis protein